MPTIWETPAVSCDEEDFLPPRAHYTLYRGDLFSIEFAFEQMTDPDADPGDPNTVWEPYPITGTLLCQVRAFDPDGEEWTVPTVDDSDGANGNVVVSISAAVMATAEPGVEYYADLQVEDDVTLAAWSFEVEPDVSRP